MNGALLKEAETSIHLSGNKQESGPARMENAGVRMTDLSTMIADGYLLISSFLSGLRRIYLTAAAPDIWSMSGSNRGLQGFKDLKN
jgi:hypothetical protein